MIIHKKYISRLSLYRKAILRLKGLGFEKVFSDTLGEAIGVNAAQVRKDFSIFGISGNRRGGYQIEDLIEKLQEILLKTERHDVIIVGAGNIGKALLQYKGFASEGIHIVAAFDIDPVKVNPKIKTPVYPMDKFEPFVKKNKIKIGAIAVPDMVAQEVCDRMMKAGIKGILNFTTVWFKGAEDAIINNVILQAELENLIYFVHHMENSSR